VVETIGNPRFVNPLYKKPKESQEELKFEYFNPKDVNNFQSQNIQNNILGHNNMNISKAPQGMPLQGPGS